MNESLLRELIPAVTGVLVRRGADFATAEDAVQEALIRALATWPAAPPTDPKGWLITAAWRRFLDATRAENSRHAREGRVEVEPAPDPAEDTDDSLQLYFLCAHPSLTPASAVGLTLRAVGGLTTRQIAEAYLVPEATMAQRISRAKRTVSGMRFDEPGDLTTDARTVQETDWMQIVEWYDELDRFAGNPVVRVNRAVAVGEADGPQAGLSALAQVDPSVPRYAAVEAHLREQAGDLARAARLYGDAARAATNLAERDHLTRQAARLNDALRR